MSIRSMVIQQAMGAPEGRRQAAESLAAAVEATMASGFAAGALVRRRIQGAPVAPLDRSGT